MKKITFLLIIALSIFIYYDVEAQNQAPIAYNDTVYCTAGLEVEIFPLVNDFDYEEDTIKIEQSISLSNYDYINYAILDSSIKITPHYHICDKRTIMYRIYDEHGAVSNSGKIVIYIDNKKIIDTLNIGNVQAVFGPIGNIYQDNDGGNTFHVPQNSEKNLINASAPWIGGQSNSALHMAAEQYGTNAHDYSPGPLADPNLMDAETDSIWNRVWQVTKTEIDYHRSHFSSSSYVMSDVILNWPAHGDISKGQAYYLAPFFDYDQDGTYNPHFGDYPKIRGDQTVLMIYNDSLTYHYATDGKALGVDIIVMAYAFDCPQDSSLNNSIFYHYEINNRSNNNYSNTYFGIFADLDIGAGQDDYCASDVDRSLFYAYNGDSIDGTGIQSWAYGANPPAMGISLLSENFDNIMYFNAYGSGAGNYMLGPDTDQEHYNYMKSIWKDGTHLYYGGDGYNNTQGIYCKYAFPDLSDSQNIGTNGIIPSPKQWTEETAANYVGDRRMLGSNGPLYFSTGGTLTYDYAYVYARSTDIDNSIDLLKIYVDSLQFYYNNDITPCGGGFSPYVNIKEIEEDQNFDFNLYPNPAHNYLTIECSDISNNLEYTLYNLMGQIVISGEVNNSIQNINVSDIDAGIYLLQITNESYKTTKKIVLQK